MREREHFTAALSFTRRPKRDVVCSRVEPPKKRKNKKKMKEKGKEKEETEE